MQPEKATLPISMTLSGIEIDRKEVQFENAELSILLMLLGISTDSKEVQLEKAELPIVVTLLGILTDIKEIQKMYLQPIITQYFIDNKSEIWLLFLIAHSKR